MRRFKPDEIEQLVDVYGEEAWILLAFDPTDPRLPAFKRAKALIEQMSPEVAEKWIGIADVLVEAQK